MKEAISEHPRMLITWDQEIVMDDGNILRADIFRPDTDEPCPVIMNHGPYGKGIPFQTGYAYQWKVMEEKYPETVNHTSNRYAAFEAADPEYWVGRGYAVIRVDMRGAGRSPGKLDPFSKREIRDYYNCIEWAGTREWCNGKVGLLGVSYYAMGQWMVAALQPPHLAAICPWEGSTDFYRDMMRHGGILTTMGPAWYNGQVASVQHGKGERLGVNPNNGELFSGPETLSDEELLKNRVDYPGQILGSEMINDWYAERTPDISKVRVPVLATANWAAGGHLRGCFEGFMAASSEEKWMEAHSKENWVEFYTTYGLELQGKFFDHYLKGIDNGWENTPRIMLNLREPGMKTRLRCGNRWPLEGTEFKKLYLDFAGRAITHSAEMNAGEVTFNAKSAGVTLLSEPFEEEVEITGCSSAKLFAASSTDDADIFVALRLFAPDGEEVVYTSVHDDKGVPALGWLRASHRKLDPARSRPERPFHTHDEKQPLTPGETYELDIEIWPTSIVVPKGYKLGVTFMGRDFEFQGPGPWETINGIEMRGVGGLRHELPDDRTPNITEADITLSSGDQHIPYLLLPFCKTDD